MEFRLPDKNNIKAELTEKALLEIGRLKRVVRKGKLKRVRKARNDAEKTRITGRSKTKRRLQGRKSRLAKLKKGSLRHKMAAKQKRARSMRRGRGIKR